MPERPQYWTTSSNQFKKVKKQLVVSGQFLFDELKELGFTEFKSPPDFLGCFIIRNANRIITSVEISYVEGTPAKFVVGFSTTNKDVPEDNVNGHIWNTFLSVEDLNQFLQHQTEEIKEKIKTCYNKS